MRVFAPEGNTGEPAGSLAQSPTVLRGARIAVLDNGKPNAGLLMGRIAEGLAERTGSTVTHVTGKGDRANAATGASDQVIRLLSEEVDIVLTGSAD